MNEKNDRRMRRMITKQQKEKNDSTKQQQEKNDSTQLCEKIPNLALTN